MPSWSNPGFIRPEDLSLLLLGPGYMLLSPGQPFDSVDFRYWRLIVCYVMLVAQSPESSSDTIVANILPAKSCRQFIPSCLPSCLRAFNIFNQFVDLGFCKLARPAGSFAWGRWVVECVGDLPQREAGLIGNLLLCVASLPKDLDASALVSCRMLPLWLFHFVCKLYRRLSCKKENTRRVENGTSSPCSDPPAGT
jgi:hypothetical protein